MILGAILLIIVIVLVTAYLITRETKSHKAERRFGRIIAIASIIILIVVIFAGYMFMINFK